MEKNIIRGKRILLVDDEPGVRGAFCMMLEFDGHKRDEHDGERDLNPLSHGGGMSRMQWKSRKLGAAHHALRRPAPAPGAALAVVVLQF